MGDIYNSRGGSRGDSRGGNLTDNMFYGFNEIKSQEYGNE